MQRDERWAKAPRAAAWQRGVIDRLVAVVAAALLALPGPAPTVAAQEARPPSETRPPADGSASALTVGEVVGNPGEYDVLYPSPFEGVQNVTADGILDNPGRYMGATVSVRGPVEDVFGPRAFTVSDGDLLVDEDILVVATRPMLDAAGRANDRAVSVDPEVVATGTLRTFDREEVERTYGVDLDDARLAEWAGKPVILVTSIRADRR